METKTLEEIAQVVLDGLDRPAKEETLAAYQELVARAAASDVPTAKNRRPADLRECQETC